MKAKSKLFAELKIIERVIIIIACTLIYSTAKTATAETPTPTVTPSPVPTIHLSLNQSEFKNGDDLWLNIALTIPPECYEGYTDMYVLLQTPSSFHSFYSFLGMEKQLLVNLLAYTLLGDRTENPQIALPLTASSKGFVYLSAYVKSGTTSRKNCVDVYCAISTPWDTSYWYVYLRRFLPINLCRPALANVRIDEDKYASAGSFSLWDSPKGIYTWYAVLVPPGSDVMDSKNWLCKVAHSTFEIGDEITVPHFEPTLAPYLQNMFLEEKQIEIGPWNLHHPLPGMYTWQVYLVKAGTPMVQWNILSSSSIQFEIINPKSESRLPSGR